MKKPSIIVIEFKFSMVNDPANFGNCTIMDFEGETEIVPCKFRDGLVFLMI